MFAKILLSALLTALGSLFIDILYARSNDLTFPHQISARSHYRTCILFVILTFFFNLTDNLWFILAIYLLTLMTITDFEQYMLFDAMTLPLAVFGVLFALQTNFFDSFLASIVGGAFFLLLAVISKGSLGGGDVKLIFALGFWLGTYKLLNTIIVGTVAGGFAAIILILMNKKDRSSFFAYGPYFALSAIYFMLK